MNKLILGGLVIGGKLNENESKEFLKYATELGITEIDTGSLYGNGNSEKLISSFNRYSSKKIKIHTKIGLIKKLRPDKTFGVELSKLTPEYIESSILDILKRLNSNNIERLSLHGYCPFVPIEEQVGKLSELIQKGLIKSYGICNFNEIELQNWIDICLKNNLQLPASLDLNFNILEQRARKKIFPILEEKSIKAIPYRVLCRGLLAGRYDNLKNIPINSRAESSWRVKRFLTEKNLKLAKSLKEIAFDNNISLLSLIFKWTFSFNPISSICIGTGSKKQLTEIVDAYNSEVKNWEKINSSINKVIDEKEVINYPETFFEK